MASEYDEKNYRNVILFSLPHKCKLPATKENIPTAHRLGNSQKNDLP